jgi:hypothetical protein
VKVLKGKQDQQAHQDQKDPRVHLARKGRQDRQDQKVRLQQLGQL